MKKSILFNIINIMRTIIKLRKGKYNFINDEYIVMSVLVENWPEKSAVNFKSAV